MHVFSRQIIRFLILPVILFVGLLALSLTVSPHWPEHFIIKKIPLIGGVNYDIISFLCVLILLCFSIIVLMLPERETPGKETIDLTPLPPLQERAQEREPDTNQLLQETLQRILTTIATHGEATQAYVEVLDKTGHNLIEITSPEQLRLTIGFLVAENDKIRKKSQELNGNLKEAESQIAALRDRLHHAEESGLRDPLTGIWNRGAFDRKLEEAAHHARLSNTPLSLVLIDIDKFKNINDQFGHQIGDEILRLVAKIISYNIKGRDSVARYGGEEFAVILPRTPLQHAIGLANQIRQQLEQQSWVLHQRKQKIGRVTASFGVAVLQPGEKLDQLIFRSDTCLYAAKRNGRNQVVS